MKIRILLVIVALLVLGLGAASFASKQTNSTPAMSCCCNGESCAKKSKDGADKEKMSCCDDCDCCKGDSCPMKSKDGAAKDKASCCEHMGEADSCPMGEADSCPMKKSGEKPQAVETKSVTADTTGHGCCCSCCGEKKKV